jgi:tagatose-1,6-bisphosphate aldolase non-catalytic subunit AgaZ/GatZ
LQDAWERVAALVVHRRQVATIIFLSTTVRKQRISPIYSPDTRDGFELILQISSLPASLRQMVEDQLAVLKVGPALTSLSPAAFAEYINRMAGPKEESNYRI